MRCLQMAGRKERIEMGDGAGGELMRRMLSRTVLPNIRETAFGDLGDGLHPDLLDDSASVGDDLAFTIDGHTIWPLEFPGGDIGGLSIFGTVNDLAVVGAKPRAIALSMVLEEGLDLQLLERISRSIGSAAKKADVTVVTGDTKVVEKGGVKGMVIATAGIGWRHELLSPCLERSWDMRLVSGKVGRRPRWLRDDSVMPGDHIILSGHIGDHGISVLSFREGYGFETEVRSDVAPMNRLIEEAMRAGGIVASKDLTRGGLAGGLNEWASKSRCDLLIDETLLPVREPVRSACDMLGLDPYEIGNEGKVIISVVDGFEDEVLRAVRSLEEGKEAVIIGQAVKGSGKVVLRTEVGGKRFMDPPYGDPVPRIC